MYQNVVALSAKTHANKRFTPLRNYRFARDQGMIPVAARELSRLAARLPLAFVTRGDAAEPRLIAMLGLDGQTNLLVGPDGRWLNDYVPAAVRRYPFILTRPSDGEAAPAVAIDTAAGVLSDTEGEPLFTADGEPAERLNQAKAILREFTNGVETTHRAAQALARADLLEDWHPTVTVGDKRWRLNGLQSVSEQKLNALDDARFAELRREGVIPLAYAQMLSMAHLPALVRLANAHAQKAKKGQQSGGNTGKTNGAGGGDVSFNFDA
ncbi:SapC family protein [Aquisalimonas sp. APHAB1-3]|uniref:SapC family protein n=1 Tax=Aquisalimonas sp. APHAB1-3 TaxID=3402080 RepID=UPI003AAF3FC4